MRGMRLTAVFAALLAFATSLPAWNATGHKVIAAIAYDRLTPTARARVDDLIRRHPDYESNFLKDAPRDPAARARFAFINASFWPDSIRNDPRFYNEERRDAKPTPLLPGFPDMGRHVTWHYKDLPMTQDGTPLKDAAAPNAITEIERFTRVISRPASDRANPVYALPWLLHLIGDMHNPLHATARFSKEHPDGDQGGNLVYVQPGRNLHAFWDSLAGDSPDLAYVASLARELDAPGAPARPIDASPADWGREGWVLGWTVVYTFGPQSGAENSPVRLPEEYQVSAKRLGKNALLAAGQRLAYVLNRELR